MKLLSALLPVLVAMAVSNLVTAFKYVGLIDFLISLGNVILLQLRSQWVCKQRFTAALKEHIDLAHSSNGGDRNDGSKEDLLLSSSHNVKPSHLYMTPYSTVLSYWPVVVIVTAVCTVMFGFNVFSYYCLVALQPSSYKDVLWSCSWHVTDVNCRSVTSHEIPANYSVKVIE